jgi:hypothetical protein
VLGKAAATTPSGKATAGETATTAESATAESATAKSATTAAESTTAAGICIQHHQKQERSCRTHQRKFHRFGNHGFSSAGLRETA